MPENEKYRANEKLLILPLGEESKKITQVSQSETPTGRQLNMNFLLIAPLSSKRY